jgi:hypothetical protein
VLIKLREICADVKFLGSYPRHDNASGDGKVAEIVTSAVAPQAWLDNLRKRVN